jgi:hypothetical protein
MKKAFSATPNRYSNKGKRWAGKRFKIRYLCTLGILGGDGDSHRWRETAWMLGFLDSGVRCTPKHAPSTSILTSCLPA